MNPKLSEHLEQLLVELTEQHKLIQDSLDSLQNKLDQVDQAIKSATTLKLSLEEIDNL